MALGSRHCQEQRLELRRLAHNPVRVKQAILLVFVDITVRPNANLGGVGVQASHEPRDGCFKGRQDGGAAPRHNAGHQLVYRRASMAATEIGGADQRDVQPRAALTLTFTENGGRPRIGFHVPIGEQVAVATAAEGSGSAGDSSRGRAGLALDARGG